MATPQNLIDDALKEIGALAADESPASYETTFCLRKLNRLLDSWNTRKLFAYVINHNSYTFATSKQSYTIGPASSTPDFTAPRPVRIERANLVLVAGAPDSNIPLEIINTDDYAALQVPALSGLPTKLYYQPTVTKGTLWPWPYPTDTANKLELFTWNQLGSIASADLATAYALPPGYEDAIIYSLAESLLPSFPAFATPSLVATLERLGREARANISGLNSRIPKMDTQDWGIPASEGPSDFDYRTGGFG